MSDEFQIARRLYLARRKLFEKADKLLEEASPRVGLLVTSLEQADGEERYEPPAEAIAE